MAFFESDQSKRFSNPKLRFGNKETQSFSAAYKNIDKKRAAKAAVSSKPASNHAPLQQTTAQFDQNTPRFQDTGGAESFSQAQPDIRSNDGYEIQSNVIAENPAKVQFVDEQKATYPIQADNPAEQGLFVEKTDEAAFEQPAQKLSFQEKKIEFIESTDEAYQEKVDAFFNNAEQKAEIRNHKPDILEDREKNDSDQKGHGGYPSSLEQDHPLENRPLEEHEESLFRSSNAKFQDPTCSFKDKVAESFMGESKNAYGNGLFLATAEPLRNGSRRHSAFENKEKAVQQSRSGQDQWIGNDQRNQAKFSGGTDRFSRDGTEPAAFRSDYGKKKQVKKGRDFKREEKEFEDTEIRDGNNKHLKSADSYFSNPKADKASNTTLRKKDEGGATAGEDGVGDKGEDKGKAGLAARAAVNSVKSRLKLVKNYINGGEKSSSGDLLKDQSNSGVIGMIKDDISTLLRFIGGLLLPVIAIPLIVILAIVIICVPIGIIIYGVTSASVDTNYEVVIDDTLEGDGYTFTSLTEGQILDILTEASLVYGGLTSAQESALNYALHRVGCAYSQAYHGNMSANVFDCSSLAYRAFLNAGIDISYVGAFTASYECFGLEESGKIISSTSELMPGDLIFYGGASNGRHKGIYHVAIYCGNGKMVEARGRKYGVVYGDVRINNIVSLCRPW